MEKLSALQKTEMPVTTTSIMAAENGLTTDNLISWSREPYKEPFILALDFDGTTVMHEYPQIGDPVPGAIKVLHREVDRGTKIILYTMRSGKELVDAVKYCGRNSIDLWGINENPDQHKWTTARKVYAHMYVDDAACGCPLIYPPGARPYVDWKQIAMLIDHYHQRTTPIQIHK